jgi:hypothetical protein
MEALSSIAEILRDLLIFVAVMAVLLIVLIVVIAWMPEHNLLKRLLTALSFRVGATVAAGALAFPSSPFPVLMFSMTSARRSCCCSTGFRFSGRQAARSPIHMRGGYANQPPRVVIRRLRTDRSHKDIIRRFARL